MTIPDSVTYIGECAFCGCTNLKKIVVPDSITSIGGSTFYGCTSLTEITIPDGVTNIEGFVFTNTPWLIAKQEENPLVIINGTLIDGTTCTGSVTIQTA